MAESLLKDESRRVAHIAAGKLLRDPKHGHNHVHLLRQGVLFRRSALNRIRIWRPIDRHPEKAPNNFLARRMEVLTSCARSRTARKRKKERRKSRKLPRRNLFGSRVTRDVNSKFSGNTFKLTNARGRMYTYTHADGRIDMAPIRGNI